VARPIGVIPYGTVQVDLFRLAAGYVDRIPGSRWHYYLERS
jgi:hypothetical protein